MKKLIKFDLEKAKSGEYGIVTRKGLGVEILSWNDTENKERPIAAKTDFENRVVLYYNNGRFDKKRNSEKDLFLMEKSDYDRYWGLKRRISMLIYNYDLENDYFEAKKQYEYMNNKLRKELKKEFGC